MNVLSLFNGMGCAEIALIEANIQYDLMYTSEIDKFCLMQTRFNFPNNIELGDVRDIDVSKLEKIDLLMGGSPCQSFSFAGKRKGMSTKCEIEIYTLEKYLELKEQGFEFEGQSYLFWEYMRILNDIRKYNPNVLFLLENVEMGAKWERVLSNAIGVFGVHINSALVSAQNRRRIYWTNIRVKHVGLFSELHSDIPQPKDRGILLRDILESNVDEKYYLSTKMLNYFDKRASNFNNGKVNIRNENDKASCITASCKSVDISDNFIKVNTSLSYANEQNKSGCLTAGGNSGGLHSDMDLICVSMVGRKTDENGVRKDNDPKIKAQQRLEPNLSGKTNCLTSVQKDNLVVIGGIKNNLFQSGISSDFAQGQRVYDTSRKGIALTSQGGGLGAKTGLYCENYRIRRLTPTECTRLQTIPNWYKWVVSDTQIYKMLGNGWTIKVIKHILSFI